MMVPQWAPHLQNASTEPPPPRATFVFLSLILMTRCPAPKPVMAPDCCQGLLPDIQEPSQPASINLLLAVASCLVSGADFFLASLPLPTVSIPPTHALSSGQILPLCSITQCLRPSQLPPLCPQGCPWVQPLSELTLIRPCWGMLTAALAPGSRPLPLLSSLAPSLDTDPPQPLLSSRLSGITLLVTGSPRESALSSEL